MVSTAVLLTACRGSNPRGSTLSSSDDGDCSSIRDHSDGAHSPLYGGDAYQTLRCALRAFACTSGSDTPEDD